MSIIRKFKEMTINLVFKRIIAVTILKSRHLENAQALDDLINATVQDMTAAFHHQGKLMTEKEVAARWPCLNVIRLRNMRYKENGPPYLKLGESRNSRIFYKFSDIETWLATKYNTAPVIAYFGARRPGNSVKVGHSFRRSRPPISGQSGQ